MNSLKKVIVVFLVATIVLTIFFGIYMAQPWGDNYAYRSIGDYFALAVFLMFAISPYVFFLIAPKFFRENYTATITLFIGTIIIAAVGLYSYFDVAFIHLDAQGGLIFIFLPIYQWMAAALLIAICFVIKRTGSSNA